MPRVSRRALFESEASRQFHIFSRTVRQAFLFGRDPVTGVNYSARREWIVDRLKLLARSFAIGVDFHALMSNHIHLLLRTFPRRAKRMSREEVARRWLTVFPGKRVLDGNWIEPTQQQVEALASDKKQIEKLRKRLSSISWFMQALSEYVARRCNLEEGRKGHFWEERFGCKEIGDAIGLLTCGLYIDLNQIRAGDASLPEECLFSSVGLRIAARLAHGDPSLDGWLSAFTLGTQLGLDELPSASGLRATDKGLLDMTFEEYLPLLDWFGRYFNLGKGSIPEDAPPILERLGLQPKGLWTAVRQYATLFKRFVGRPETFTKRSEEYGVALRGIRAARDVFQPPERE